MPFLSFTPPHSFAATLRISAAQVQQAAAALLLAAVLTLSYSGGYLLYAWEYMSNHGLASDACIPYASGSGHPPACPSTCADNRTITRTAALLSSVAYSGSAAQLQNEIIKNGPIQVQRTMHLLVLQHVLLGLRLTCRWASTFTTTSFPTPAAFTSHPPPRCLSEDTASKSLAGARTMPPSFRTSFTPSSNVFL